MIAFSSGNVLEVGNYNDNNCYGDGCRNYILSIKYGAGHCVSKVLVTDVGVPRQLTVVMLLDNQADIVAIPELYSSVYVPWHLGSPHRVTETARAFLNSGLPEQAACCAAIAVDIIYNAIDRDFVDYSGSPKDCIFTSSGIMELNDDCRDRVLNTDYVLSEFPFDDGDELPF